MNQLWSELTKLDRPEILQFVFYPRKDLFPEPEVDNAFVCAIPVAEGVDISCRFYFGDRRFPNVLYFHGNGELASDYDGIGTLYNQVGTNLFVADYRGYGMSGGSPTLTDMIKDAQPIFEGFKQVLKERNCAGKLFIMGRSLGSASAIELAYRFQSEFAGLILESGFANMFKLLQQIGFPLRALGLSGKEKSSALELIGKVTLPTLVIHGEYDQIVPMAEGKALYDKVATKDKRMLVIPGVDHNTLLLGGMQQYFQTMRDFVSAHT